MSKFRTKNVLKTIGWILLGMLAGFIVLSIILMMRFELKTRNQPETIGVSFSQVQAERYHVDWQQNYTALLDDLGFKHLRIAAYWDRTEPAESQYDFSETDWMIAQAKARGAKVTLTIGQKLIRYPECHYPGWLDKNNASQVREQIDPYLTAVVDRYKNDPTVEAWQLENEFLLRSFGDCPDQNLTSSQLTHELSVVKQADASGRPVVLTQSDQFGFPLLGPFADVFGFSMYRNFWNTQLQHYLSYPQTGNYNWLKAAWINFLTGQGIKIHELQAEAWGPVGNENLSFAEANKTMNPELFNDNLAYARATRIKSFDLWGAEWWYALKNQGHPEMWQAVRAELRK